MGTITLRAPDGTPRKFGIAGDTPTADELTRFQKIMAQTNPAPVQEDPTATFTNPLNVAKEQYKLSIRAGNDLGTVGARTEPSPERPSTPTDNPVDITPRPDWVAPSEDTMSVGSLAQVQTPVGQEVVSPTPSVMSEMPSNFRGEEYAEKRANQDQYPDFISYADQAAMENEQQRNDQSRAGAVEARGDDDEVARGTPSLDVDTTQESGPTTLVDAQQVPARELPAPSSGMFDDLSETFLTDDQKADIVVTTLDEYMNHPRTVRRWDGRYIYTDENGDEWRVPRIYWNKASNRAEVLDSWSFEGFEDGVKNTVEFVADVADLARDMISDEGVTDENSWGQWVRDNTSQYSEEGRGLRALGGEFAGIFGVGGPVLKGVRSFTNLVKSGKEVGRLRQMAGSLGNRTAEAIIFTAPIDGDSSGLLLGENALLKASDYMPILADLDPDATDAEWQQRLENRRNMILEGAAISKLFTSTVNAGVQGVRVLNSMTIGGLWSATRTTSQQKAAMADITEKLLRVEGARTPAERKAFLEEFAAALDTHANEINSINDSLIQGSEIDRSTMNAFMVAVDEGDLAGAADIASRFNNPQGLINVAGGVQQGAVQNPSMANTATKSEAAQAAYNTALGTVDNNLGGAATIQRAATEIQTGPLGDDAARLRATGDNLADLERQLDALDDELVEAINKGGEVSSRFNRLSQLTGVNLSQAADNAADSLLSRVTAAYRNIKGQRTDVYSGVQGGDLDTRGLYEFLREMDPADLTEAATTLGYSPRLKALLNAVSDKNKTVAGDTVSGLDNFDPVPTGRQSVAMTDDELFEEFSAALEEAGIVDYGTLFQNLRADLATAKGALFESGGNAQRSAGLTINQLIKYIDGDLLDNTQSVELIESVQKAKDWDAANYLPFFGDKETALGKVATMYDQKLGSTEIAGVARSTSYEDLSRNVLTDSLTQRTRAQGVQIVKLLQRPEAGSTEELTDYILFESLQPIMSALRTTGQTPTNESMNQALNTLLNYRSVLSQADPKLYSELSELGDSLANGTYDRGALLNRLDQAQRTYDRTKTRLQESAVVDFFDAQGIPRDIGMDAYNKLINNFTSADNTGRLNTLAKQFMEEAKNGNPLLLEGLQAAYIKRFREATMTNTMGASRSGGIKQIRAAQELDNETGKWLDGLRIVFQDRPEAAELIEVLYAKAAQEQGFRLARAARSESGTSRILGPQIEKLGNIVTLIYGNLSRTGARIRRAGTAMLNKNFNAAAWDAIMDDILSNPETAKKLVDQLIREEFGSSIGEDAVEAAINGMVYAGMFGPEDEAEARAMNFEIIAATAEAEANVRDYTRDGKTFLGDLYDQSVELFSDTFLQ